MQVHILAGAAAGRTLQLEGPVISLGRDAGCDVVIDLPFISRTQCELHAQGGQWVLVNRSTNGTRLGRRLVTDKPRAVRAGDAVRVGDQVIAELTPMESPPAGPAEPAVAARPAPASASGGRAKLWIGIGIYLTLMLGLIIFFATLGEKPREPDPIAALPTLSEQQIAAEIRAPVEKRSVLESRMNEQLQLARELFEQRDVLPDALYRAHEAYRTALSYAPGGHTLPDPIDQRRLQLAETELIERVTETYRSAVALMQARNYDEAARRLARLRAMYPAGRDSAIARSVDQLSAAVKREMERRR